MTNPNQNSRKLLAACDKQDLRFMQDRPYCEWDSRLRADLSKKRYDHVIRVVRTAIVLADRFGVNVEQARTAALLHDCAKSNEKTYFDRLLAAGFVKESDWDPSPVFHAWLGARVAEADYGVTDPVVLEAIANHTTGSPDMDQVSAITFIADLIEPNRDYPSVDEIRSLAWTDLEACLLVSMNRTLAYLIKSDRPIDMRTVASRNRLLQKLKMDENDLDFQSIKG